MKSNDPMSAEAAEEQFKALLVWLRQNWLIPRMKTEVGKELLRHEIAGLRGVPINSVLFDGETSRKVP